MQLPGERGFGEVRGIGREKRAGDAEVEGEAVPFAQILWNERRGGRLILGEPAIQFGSVRDGGKTAGATESVAREASMNFGEALECGPRGSFGDGDVGERMDAVISGEDGGSCRERIVVAEDRVGGGDGGLSDGVGFVHVAEIDQG